MTAEREWEPGDPLPGRFRPSIYQGFLYNFRDDELMDYCDCPDRASWPEPLYSHDLGRWPDEVERFIEENNG